MNEFSSPEQFGSMIARTLRERPDWLQEAISAIAGGIESARRKDREHHAQVELALQCALMLANPKRINAGAIKLAQSYILKALPLEGASPAEMEAYVRYYAALHCGAKPENAGDDESLSGGENGQHG